MAKRDEPLRAPSQREDDAVGQLYLHLATATRRLLDNGHSGHELDRAVAAVLSRLAAAEAALGAARIGLNSYGDRTVKRLYRQWADEVEQRNIPLTHNDRGQVDG